MGDERNFDVDFIYIGCPFYRNGAYWEKGISTHYVAYTLTGEHDENGNIGEDVLKGEKYHFFDEMKNNGQDLGDSCVLYRMYSLRFAVDENVKKISETGLKGILAKLNILEACGAFGSKNDVILYTLNSCFKVLDLMDEGKVKTHYMNRLYKLSNDYIDIVMWVMKRNYTGDEYDELVEVNEKLTKISIDIIDISYELDKEKEIIKKRKVNKKKRS